MIANTLNNMLLSTKIQKTKILLNIPDFKRMRWSITLYDSVSSYLFYILYLDKFHVSKISIL